MALFLLFMLTRLVRPEGRPGPAAAVLVFCSIASLVSFGASFALKAKWLAQARALRRADTAQSGYVLAFALCESVAVFGVFSHFAARAPEAVYFFALAALGILLHFPRRRHFDEADGAGRSDITSTLR